MSTAEKAIPCTVPDRSCGGCIHGLGQRLDPGDHLWCSKRRVVVEAGEQACERYQAPSLVKCQRCEGCGQIANTEAQEPWSSWLELPIGSSAALIAGLVRPLQCPDCKGLGKRAAR